MKNFLIDHFFFLENYLHKEVFDQSDYPWGALENLSSFIEKRAWGKVEVEIPEGVHIVNPDWIEIGKGTLIEPGAYIKGPCIIGRNCEVRNGAYLRGSVITGDHCILGHGSEIKHAILLDRVRVTHFNYVGDSILGNGVNLGAGVKLANVRLDKEKIVFSGESGSVATQLKKMGAVIGDQAQLGCNCVTNPGTLIGKDTFCYPCITVSGVIPPLSIVKSKGEILCR